MAFRFWRRIRIAPGLTVNLSKSGPSLSMGPRGAKLTVGSRGVRTTAGIPGTGLFYTTHVTGKSGRGQESRRSAPAAPLRSRLNLGFFQRLVAPAGEKAFVDGCRALVEEDEERAVAQLRMALNHADAAYLAGFVCVKRQQLDDAVMYLSKAAANASSLGVLFGKYGVAATLSLGIADGVTVHVGPTLEGVLLGLIEVYQEQERWREAIDCLERLRKMDPNDILVRLSYSELLIEARPDDKGICRRVIALAGDLENESPLHAALMLYKAKALRRLALPGAAREVLTAALRRRKDRSDELLNALRYERALVYDDLGQHARARKELERIYAHDRHYEDVAARLGLA
jgi:tetratricopeptide (TPR) repeat protein